MDIKQTHSAPPDANFIDNEDARTFFIDGFEEQMNGQLEDAINLYQKSYDVFPSAQALTYLAWAHSQRKDLETAIDLCHKAIHLDVEYGNPYNDIGAYLIEMGKHQEATVWLEKAILAKKYHYKHNAYFNLGRVYQEVQLIKKAITCFEAAIQIYPGFKHAVEARDSLLESLN